MKIWLDGAWFTLPHKILIVHLTEQDKKNIQNMCPTCNLYCQYDEAEYKTPYIIKLLTKLKKELVEGE